MKRFPSISKAHELRPEELGEPSILYGYLLNRPYYYYSRGLERLNSYGSWDRMGWVCWLLLLVWWVRLVLLLVVGVRKASIHHRKVWGVVDCPKIVRNNVGAIIHQFKQEMLHECMGEWTREARLSNHIY